MSKKRVLTACPTGDFWKVVPMIRITGRWVERAGIYPGDKVEVSNPEAGVLLIVRLAAQEAERTQEA